MPSKMLVERGIGLEWVMRTVDQPDSMEADPKDAAVVRNYKAIGERGGRVLRAVCKVEAGSMVVITACLDRSKRR